MQVSPVSLAVRPLYRGGAYMERRMKQSDTSVLAIIASIALLGLISSESMGGNDLRQSISAQSIVQINAGDIQGESADEAMQKLVAALHQYPEARLFRVNWTLAIGGWGSVATALYDRRKQRVQFYCTGGEQFGVSLHEHYLYTGVTDSILSRVAEKFTITAGGSSDGFFDELPLFGCKLHVYRDTKRTNPRKARAASA